MKRPEKLNRKLYILSGCVLFALGCVLLRRPIMHAVRIIAVSGGIALVTCPLCTIYEKKLSKGKAALLTLITAVIAFILIVCAVFLPAVSALTDLYRRILPYFGENGFAERFTDVGGMDIIAAAREYIGYISTGAADAVGNVADALVSIAAAWYMLVERHTIALYAELLIPFRYRKKVILQAVQMRTELGMYLRGQAIIALCVGVLSAIGLKIVGVPYAVMLGITAGILNMIPYLGPVIACLPVGLLAFGDGLIPAALAIGVLIVVQQIDGLILSPRIVGSSTGFAPGVVLIAIFASGAVWGIVGMLLALPGLILIRTCVRVFVELGRNY